MTPAAALMLTLAGGCLNGTAISRDPPVLLAPGTVPTLLPSAPQGDHDLAISFDHWWVRYNDPVLIILISSADAGNLDIAAAQARLEQAQSQVRGARGALLPQLTGSVGATKDIGASQSFVTPYGGKTIYTGGLSASWEIDPFGGNRAGLRAAKADAQSSVATLQATRLTVIGDIARAYVDARTVKKRWDVANASLASERDTLEITRWRMQAGLVGGIDVAQAEALTAQTAATLQPLELSLRQDLNRLAVLTGQAPGSVDALMRTDSPIPNALPGVSTLIPLDIVRRRPDVAAAEATVLAETARIGVERAKLYPSFSLSGTLNGTATGFVGLADSLIASIGGTISQTLFDGGQTRAAIRAQQAKTRASLADYRATLLKALEEADNDYAAVKADTAQLALQRQAEAAARTAAIYQRSQYSTGLIDFTRLLDAERTLLSASDSRVVNEGAIAEAQVSLIQALGGDAPAKPEPGRPYHDR